MHPKLNFTPYVHCSHCLWMALPLAQDESPGASLTPSSPSCAISHSPNLTSCSFQLQNISWIFIFVLSVLSPHLDFPSGLLKQPLLSMVYLPPDSSLCLHSLQVMQQPEWPFKMPHWSYPMSPMPPLAWLSVFSLLSGRWPNFEHSSRSTPGLTPLASSPARFSIFSVLTAGTFLSPIFAFLLLQGFCTRCL